MHPLKGKIWKFFFLQIEAINAANWISISEVESVKKEHKIKDYITCMGSATPTLVLISSTMFGLPSHCISNSIVTLPGSPPCSRMEIPREH